MAAVNTKTKTKMVAEIFNKFKEFTEEGLNHICRDS